jgi:TonB family protein
MLLQLFLLPNTPICRVPASNKENKKCNMKTKKAIQNVELSFVCPQNWDSMTACGNGRFCNVCQKIVYDFTDKSQKDYGAVLRQHGGQMCGRFTKQQLSPSRQYRDVPSVNFAKVAALATLSFGITEANAQKFDSIPILPPPPPLHQVSDDKDAFLGMIVKPYPEFIGGTKVMFEFLRENIKYPQTCRNVDGTVYVGFVVKTDGSLADVNVKRGVHPDMDAEAVRVVKLMSGKWKPGMQSGKPANTSYTLPIKFMWE